MASRPLVADRATTIALSALLLLPLAGCLDESPPLPVAPSVSDPNGLPVLRPGGTAPTLAPGGKAPEFVTGRAAPAEVRAAIGSRLLSRQSRVSGGPVLRLADAKKSATGRSLSPARASAATSKTVGTGSANADVIGDKSHFILSNLITGDRAVWVVDNGVITEAAYLGLVPLGWRVVGGGDLNNDRFEDVLWENELTHQVAVWLMNGNAGVIDAVSLGFLPPDWHIAGTIDYDDDRNVDVLLENTANGNRAVWRMNGAGGVVAAISIGILDAQWRMIAGRDLTNDGQDDILLMHRGDGRVVLWTVGGGRTFNASLLGTLPLHLYLAGIGPVDADLNHDIIWENVASGERVVWLMNGRGGVVAAPTLTVEPNTAWHIDGVLVPTLPATVDPCDVEAARPLLVGQTVDGALTGSDCDLGDGTRVDIYRLVIHEPATVIMDMTSTAINTYLFLTNSNPVPNCPLPRSPLCFALLQQADDGAGGTNARIARVMGPGVYFILTNNWEPAGGPYQLGLRTASIVFANSPSIMATMAGTATPNNPTVLVRSPNGSPVAGATVTFALTSGGGTITGEVATTDVNGIAALGSWITNATPGPSTVTATVSGVEGELVNNPLVFTASGCSGGGGTGYAITLCFMTEMSASQQTTFANAAARWGTIITGDVADFTAVSINQGVCNATSPRINMNIDDLVIFARIENIDGPSGILGSAGFCVRRSPAAPSPNIPLVGQMRFDAADVANLEASGRFNDVILHEMGHVIGIGTAWNLFGFLKNASGVGGPQNDTHHNGPNTIAGFDAVGGTTYTRDATTPVCANPPTTAQCAKAPVENRFGGGTINSHWRESVLANELMTGFLNAGTANPLSLLTVRSLQDFGYVVNPDAADPFFRTLDLRAEAALKGDLIQLVNDIDEGPQYTVDSRGRLVRER